MKKVSQLSYNHYKTSISFHRCNKYEENDVIADQLSHCPLCETKVSKILPTIANFAYFKRIACTTSFASRIDACILN